MHFQLGYGYAKNAPNSVSSLFPSLLPSLILRYFGDHGRISQRSIRFKIMALATKRSNTETERSYRF